MRAHNKHHHSSANTIVLQLDETMWNRDDHGNGIPNGYGNPIGNPMRMGIDDIIENGNEKEWETTVSYTHLTLPTNREV